MTAIDVAKPGGDRRTRQKISERIRMRGLSCQPEPRGCEVDAQAVEDDSHLCARLAVFRPGRPDLADDLFDLLVDQVARLGLMFISHGRYSLRGLSRLWSSLARRSASAWVNSSRRFTRRTSSVSKWSGRSLKWPEHHCRTVSRRTSSSFASRACQSSPGLSARPARSNISLGVVRGKGLLLAIDLDAK